MTRSEFECPACGAEVSPNATSCRECGARKVDGRWEMPEIYDGLDLGEDEFNYEDFVSREFGSGTGKKTAKEWFWWLVAILTFLAFLFLVVPF
ncbi:MAG: zinc ribbon domain-containing protein [Verrucomicrobiota bacterium]